MTITWQDRALVVSQHGLERVTAALAALESPTLDGIVVEGRDEGIRALRLAEHLLNPDPRHYAIPAANWEPHLRETHGIELAGWTRIVPALEYLESIGAEIYGDLTIDEICAWATHEQAHAAFDAQV